jgi:hypothetical protein
MMYIANRLSEAGGMKITEPQLQTLCMQAETQGVTLSPHPTSNEIEQKPIHPAVAQHENKLQSVIKKHCESLLHLLKQGQTMDLLSSYQRFRSKHFPIMTGIASLIQHLGGKDISIENLTSLTHQVEEEALRQHSDALQTETCPEILDKPKGKEISKQEAPIDPIPESW